MEADKAIQEPVEGTPQSTDSMVTVRLSDVQSIASKRASLKIDTNDNTTGPRVLTNPVLQFPQAEESSGSPSSSRRSSITSTSAVDWDELERTEGEQPRDGNSDESMAFLLARLEAENGRIEKDPKAARAHTEEVRPPSLHQLKKLMDNPDPATLRYSMLPSPPPLTDLDFYAALVNDYHRTASKLPFLLSKKIRSGVPPPLRGVVWISMSGARDSNLEATYDRLQGESSPYEQMIGKDLGRTFPGVDIFSIEDGQGQRMMGRVLRAFSIHDSEIGYCQGLGFLVGPLLMHMGEKEAFCVLVRLMENYELRSCFLPNMYGLQLRMYQLSQLIIQHLPDLAQHLDVLGIRQEYATQWFLSFFAVTCPLPMLLRIYDVIFVEGAPETIMRVAMSLLQRNRAKLLASNEFEEVMQMLLGRGLWDTYECNADDLVQDFVGLTGVVTRESLIELEAKFRIEHPEDSNRGSPTPKAQGNGLQAVASQFLGRFWATTPARENSTISLSPTAASASRPTSVLMRRNGSKQSLSTLSSYDGTLDLINTPSTDTTHISRNSIDDQRNSNRSMLSSSSRRANKDRDLHGQIEELLIAMSSLQREHASTLDELHVLQSERDEERLLTKRLVELLSNGNQTETDGVREIDMICDTLTENFAKSDDASTPKPNSKQLLADLDKARDRLSQEASRTLNLQRQLADHETEVSRLRIQVAETRSRWQDSQRDKQRLEKTITELKARKDAPRPVGADYEYFDPSPGSSDTEQTPGNGLRSFKLGRSTSVKTPTQPMFNKRSSSLGMQGVLQNTENQSPAAVDALLLELVQSKTAEAIAKQEAEEAKSKLESMRRLLGGSSGTHSAKPSMSRSNSEASAVYTPGQTTSITSMGPTPAVAAAAGAFGRWAAWGKKPAVAE